MADTCMPKTETLPPIIRDSVLLIGGLAGIFQQTVLASEVNPVLITVFASMMGLPALILGKKNEL